MSNPEEPAQSLKELLACFGEDHEKPLDEWLRQLRKLEDLRLKIALHLRESSERDEGWKEVREALMAASGSRATGLLRGLEDRDAKEVVVSVFESRRAFARGVCDTSARIHYLQQYVWQKAQEKDMSSFDLVHHVLVPMLHQINKQQSVDFLDLPWLGEMVEEADHGAATKASRDLLKGTVELIAVAYYGDHLAPGETEERSVCSLLLGVKRLGEVHDLFAVYRAPRRSASIASDDLVHLRRMAEAFNHRFAPGTIGRRSEALEFLTNCLPPWEGRRAWAERFLDMCYQARVLERGVVVADDVSLGDQLRHLREIARPAPGQALFVSAPNLGRFSQFTASRSPAPIEHLTGKGRKPIWFFVRGQVHADHHFLRVCNGIRTGVIGLSDIFWGGIPLRPEASAWKSGKGTRHLGNIVALVGPPGSGKTTWCLTLLTEFAKLGGVCVMLSPERDATDILGMLSTFGLEDPLGFRTADAGSSPDITGVLPGKGETKGLLYISGAPRFDLDTLASAVNKASSMLRDARQSIAPRRLYLAIDSLDACSFGKVDRRRLDELFDDCRRTYNATAVAVERDSGTTGLQEIERYVEDLADVLVWLSSADPQGPLTERRRVLNLVKTRRYRSRPGVHYFYMDESDGMKVYPSVAAIRSRVAGRHSEVDESRRIATGVAGLDEMFAESEGERGFVSGTSTLLLGKRGLGKTALALHAAMGPRRLGDQLCELDAPRALPDKLLIVDFGAGIDHIMANLRRYPRVYRKFLVLELQDLVILKNFPPGADPAEYYLGEISEIVERAKLEVPITRAVVSGISWLESRFPGVTDTVGLLSALKGLFRTNGITSFFIMAHDEHAAMPWARDIAAMADNLVRMRILNFHGTERRGVVFEKLYGREHKRETREITFDEGAMRVFSSFDSYMNLDYERPEPIGITLDMYEESAPQKGCNDLWQLRLRRSFGLPVEVRQISAAPPQLGPLSGERATQALSSKTTSPERTELALLSSISSREQRRVRVLRSSPADTPEPLLHHPTPKGELVIRMIDEYFFPQMPRTGALVPLERFKLATTPDDESNAKVYGDAIKDLYLRRTLEKVTIDGRIYAVPYYLNLSVLVVDKRAVRKSDLAQIEDSITGTKALARIGAEQDGRWQPPGLDTGGWWQLRKILTGKEKFDFGCSESHAAPALKFMDFPKLSVENVNSLVMEVVLDLYGWHKRRESDGVSHPCIKELLLTDEQDEKADHLLNAIRIIRDLSQYHLRDGIDAVRNGGVGDAQSQPSLQLQRAKVYRCWVSALPEICSLNQGASLEDLCVLPLPGCLSLSGDWMLGIEAGSLNVLGGWQILVRMTAPEEQLYRGAVGAGLPAGRGFWLGDGAMKQEHFLFGRRCRIHRNMLRNLYSIALSRSDFGCYLRIHRSLGEMLKACLLARDESEMKMDLDALKEHLSGLLGLYCVNCKRKNTVTSGAR